MKLESLTLNEGKRLILGVSLCAAAFLALTGCTKDPLRIKPIKEDKEIHIKDHDEINENTTKDTLDCGGFRTQTQGGWGAVPHGNNPGTYLHAHFASAFPTGLSVGCTYTLKLTSAKAVTDYLPGGGTPAVLTKNYTNPVGEIKNNLASQLVTLTLSVQFDKADPNFSSSKYSLGNLVVKAGPFAGMTVNAVLAEANKVLGGCTSKFTVSQLSAALTAMNENFDDGTSNGGYLDCGDEIIIVN